MKLKKSIPTILKVSDYTIHTKDHALIKRKGWGYLLLFFCAQIGALVLIYWLSANKSSLPAWAYPLIDGFGGNLTSGIIGSSLFLFLTLYLDAQTEQKIDHIRDVAAKSETLLSRREHLLENERTILRFEQFMKKETYHDVFFPELKLEYTIAPVRDPENGEPVKFETEMETLYLIKNREPAHWGVRTPEQRKLYEGSPIRDDEYYFCKFYNDSWHMSTESIMIPSYMFRLSGKVGPTQYGQSANNFMKTIAMDPFRDLTKIAKIQLKEDGTLAGEGYCTTWEIYKDTSGSLFLRVCESLPKKIYFTNPKNIFDDNGWFLVIENIRGYADGQKLESIKNAVSNKLNELKIDVPKIPWHNLKQ